MKQIDKVVFDSKDKLYKYINIKLLGLIGDVDDCLANLSNASGLFNLLMDDINWVGFYLMKNEKLVLGPFQGRPACVTIEIGNSVCGTAVASKTVQLVKNVHEFPGHIACDANTKSEIVLPIIVNDQVVAVLDIDSPIYNRFDEEDQAGLEKVVEKLVKYVDWSSLG